MVRIPTGLSYFTRTILQTLFLDIILIASGIFVFGDVQQVVL